MKTFRQAVEARDEQVMETLLDENVIFTSPVAFKPYQGRAITAAILRGVLRVFEDFRYIHEYEDAAGLGHALMFETKVDGKKLTGCDFLTTNADGKVTELTVMVRPLSAATALA